MMLSMWLPVDGSPRVDGVTQTCRPFPIQNFDKFSSIGRRVTNLMARKVVTRLISFWSYSKKKPDISMIFFGWSFLVFTMYSDRHAFHH